jgi:hypothetical protein
MLIASLRDVYLIENLFDFIEVFNWESLLGGLLVIGL